MPKFHVQVREVHVSTREVEAPSADEAIEKVREGTDADEEVMLEYSHTLDPDTWTVEALEEERDVLDYESNGLRVVLTGSKFQCTGCGEWCDGSEVGLRRLGPDLIRNQAQCSSCRSLHHT